MESHRIKEYQLDLFADRTSTATMQANQLRAVVRLHGLRIAVRIAPYRPGAHPVRRGHLRRTIRLKLLKLGALVRVSVRRIKIAMACACPWQGRVRIGPCPTAQRRRLTRTRQSIGTMLSPQRRRVRGGGGAWPNSRLFRW